MTNYRTAIAHPHEDARETALARFLEAELHETADRLTGLEDENGGIPAEVADQWNYEKGRLDTLRLLYGLVQQRRAHDELTRQDEEVLDNRG